MRMVVFRVLKGMVPVVGAITQDGTVLVSTRDREVGRAAFVYGGFEREGFQHALSIAASYGYQGLSGRVFVEVGANIGTTTLQAARTASRCVVIEPEPGNVRLLRASLAINGLTERVDVVAAAAAADPGVLYMELSQDNHGDHRVSEKGSIQVASVRLDDILAERDISPRDVGLLWMDTQGFEGQVLAGAPGLLESPPVTVTEYWPELLRPRGDLERFVTEIERCWAHVIDLRSESLAPESMAIITARYADRGFTDLLLMPRPRE